MKSIKKQEQNAIDAIARETSDSPMGEVLESAPGGMKIGSAGQERIRSSCIMLNRPCQLTGVLSPDGRVIVVNEVALEFAGVTESEVYGRRIWECPWWAHSGRIQNGIKVAVQKAAGGKSFRFETTNLDKNGYIHHMDFSLSPVFGEGGDVEYLVHEALDITEIKKQEAASDESEAPCRVPAETTREAMFILNWNLFVEGNQKTLEVLRCGRKEIIGCRITDFIPTEQPGGGDSRKMMMEKIEAALRGRPQSFTLMFSRFDGEPFEAGLCFSRIDLSTGPHILGRLKDVTTEG